MMGEWVCKYCERPISNDCVREFDGNWYHNGSCVKTAIKAVEDELAERGLKSGDMVYIVLPGCESSKVMLEPAVLIKRIASPDPGWSERWAVHYLRDPSEDVYEREVSPACLIRRAAEPVTIDASSLVY